jgi:hypothetical protein
MNKKIFVLLAILLLVTGSLILLSQLTGQEPRGKDEDINSNLPNDTPDVKITAFNWTSGWGAGPVGLMMGRGFNITLCNLDAKDLEELTLTIKMMNVNGSELQTETRFYGPGVIGYTEFGPFDGILHAGEVRTLRGSISSDFGTLTSAWSIGFKSKQPPITTLAQVSLNGTVLDELYIYQS